MAAPSQTRGSPPPTGPVAAPPESNGPPFGHRFWAPFKTPPHKSGRLRETKKDGYMTKIG